MGRRAQLTSARRRCLELGRDLAYCERKEVGDDAYIAEVEHNYWFTTSVEWAALWRRHHAEILETWIRENPGTRPWGWWHWTAKEPRRVIRGAELVVSHQADVWWRDNFGIPAMLQARPRGRKFLPLVEAQAAYLKRLDLLTPDERAALDPEDFAPEETNPFLIDAGGGAVRMVDEDDDTADNTVKVPAPRATSRNGGPR